MGGAVSCACAESASSIFHAAVNNSVTQLGDRITIPNIRVWPIFSKNKRANTTSKSEGCYPKIKSASQPFGNCQHQPTYQPTQRAATPHPGPAAGCNGSKSKSNISVTYITSEQVLSL